MDDLEARERQRRQIERLLGFPGVGPLTAEAIAVNVGVPAGSLDAVLEALVKQGRLARMNDGRFTLPVVGGER